MASLDPVAPPRRERKKAETRTAIVGAAWLLFQRKGVSATSIRDIAQLADVSDTTVTNYFATKDKLIEAVIDQHKMSVDVLAQEVCERPSSESPATAVRRAFATLASSWSDQDLRRLLPTMRGIEAQAELRGASLRMQIEVAGSLAQALRQRAGTSDVDDVSLAVYCRAVIGALDEIARHQPARPRASTWSGQIDDALARLEKGWTA